MARSLYVEYSVSLHGDQCSFAQLSWRSPKVENTVLSDVGVVDGQALPVQATICGSAVLFSYSHLHYDDLSTQMKAENPSRRADDLVTTLIAQLTRAHNLVPALR